MFGPKLNFVISCALLCLRSGLEIEVRSRLFCRIANRSIVFIVYCIRTWLTCKILGSYAQVFTVLNEVTQNYFSPATFFLILYLTLDT